ncbi:UNVERIFIED_CONTAM: hypothetical protein RMT77_010684 [Armadillidium vulgare]
MPSKEELCFFTDDKSRPSTNQEFLSRDIDNLVQEIKDNLRLKAKPLKVNNKPPKFRASPYSVPSRTESKCGCCNSHRCLRRTSSSTGNSSSSSSRRNSEDPYEMLQDLLKEGDLIKEAVKRLQLGLVPVRRCVYYDSDEEFRTPPFPFDDVEV